MNVTITDEISVVIKAKARKTRDNSDIRKIYLEFGIFQNGIKLFCPEVATSFTVQPNEWTKGLMKGRSERANLINESIAGYFAKARTKLEILRLKNIKTCQEVNHEILSVVKTTVSGKASKGKKHEYLSKLSEHSCEVILKNLLAAKTRSKKRQENYHSAMSLLTKFYKDDIPTINEITEADLTAFKIWYIENIAHTQNTRATYTGMIRSIFTYAIKKRLIPFSPIPEGFVESFIDVSRTILTEEEIQKIKDTDDGLLTIAQKRAKYSLLVQSTTGIAYCDLQDLKTKHLITDKQTKNNFFAKRRNKTGEPFEVPFTQYTNIVVAKLREISSGVDDYLFKLPKISTARKNYKKIAKIAGVNEAIATYTLRHSFSEIYMDNMGDIENLQKMLGHKNLKTTQTYGRITKKRLIEGMQKVEQRSLVYQT